MQLSLKFQLRCPSARQPSLIPVSKLGLEVPPSMLPQKFWHLASKNKLTLVNIYKALTSGQANPVLGTLSNPCNRPGRQKVLVRPPFYLTSRCGPTEVKLPVHGHTATLGLSLPDAHDSVFTATQPQSLHHCASVTCVSICSS